MINPTGYTALDLVGFTDRGTYASNVNYVKNDIVHYGGNLWICKIDDTMNVTPAEGENWTVFVGEPTNLVERIIAPLEENPATVAYAAGRQIIYDDWLWEVIDDIAVGDPLIDYAVDPTNANIKKAAPVETQLLDIKAKVGPLASLATTIKTSIVAAINEIVGKIGDLSLLGTTDKSSAVNAINEVNTKVSKTEVLISIVENGNTCTHTGGISKGQYVNWKGQLYTADSNISVGATFASSGGSKNLTAVADGGLNNVRIEGNTDYCKLPDGTLIIYGLASVGNISANSFADFIITFPNVGVSFISTPRVVANSGNASYTPYTEITGPNIISAATNKFSVRFRNNYNSALSVYVSYIAIGRWK